MKAIVYEKYGPPEDVLKLQDIDRPVPTESEVLVRVRAAGLQAGDWVMVRGVPYFMRPSYGFKPKNNVAGFDVAGHVEAVGSSVTRFQPGDEVFGWCKGACAEFACADEASFAPKPSNLTFEEASTVPSSAQTALQALRDQGKVQPKQKVLVIGASGGVGTFAVQIGKAFGAEVSGVCSTRNVEMVRSIGADDVIDYTKEDIGKSGRRYDLILDMAGNRPLSHLRRVLTPKGTLLLVGGRGGPWLMGMERTIRALLLSPFVSQRLAFFVTVPTNQDLRLLKQLIEDGKVKPVIDRTYPLRETPEAVGYIERGHARGKVVISIGAESSANPSYRQEGKSE